MNLIIFMFCAIVLLVGLILTVTPWLMPKTECFTVTVPHGARNEEPLRGLLRSYTCWMVAITALCVLAWPATLALGRIDVTTRSGEFVLTLLLFVTTFAPIIASFALMLSYRARVKAVKQERGWTAEHAAAAFVGTEDFPKPLSLAWNLLYLPLIGGLAAFTLSHYDQFPSQIPMNIDLAGNVTSSVPKSPLTVLFPPSSLPSWALYSPSSIGEPSTRRSPSIQRRQSARPLPTQRSHVCKASSWLWEGF